MTFDRGTAKKEVQEYGEDNKRLKIYIQNVNAD